MSIEGAANFLVGTILAGLGFGIIGIVIIFLNNLFAKYWKPMSLPGIMAPPPVSYIHDADRIDPTVEQQKEAVKTKNI
jgi:hypothetical protein